MLKRSIDMLKSYYDPHEFAGSVEPKWLESAADSLHRLFREALETLHASKTVAESTRFQLEQHFGMRLLRGKMATDPCRFQGLRGVPFSQIFKRATVLFDKSDLCCGFTRISALPVTDGSTWTSQPASLAMQQKGEAAAKLPKLPSGRGARAIAWRCNARQPRSILAGSNEQLKQRLWQASP